SLAGRASSFSPTVHPVPPRNITEMTVLGAHENESHRYQAAVAAGFRAMRSSASLELGRPPDQSPTHLAEEPAREPHELKTWNRPLLRLMCRRRRPQLLDLECRRQAVSVHTSADLLRRPPVSG